MENHVPIESVTPGQAGKLYDMFVASLCKSGSPKEPSQQVIEHQGAQVVRDMVAVFCKYVEAISNLIVRHVTMNRTRTPMEAINATGRNKYVNDAVVAIMPQGEGDEADMIFFKPDKLAYDKNGLISDDEVARQYEMRGLKPADPYLLAAANEQDPAFADEHPNATHWKDANGNWCYAAFCQWSVDERIVNVRRSGLGWDDDWWFGGVRK